MRLLYCKDCRDVFRLVQNKKRLCRCGKSGGMQVHVNLANFFGPAAPIGFNESSLKETIDEPYDTYSQFEAYVIQECLTFVRVEDESVESCDYVG